MVHISVKKYVVKLLLFATFILDLLNLLSVVLIYSICNFSL